MAILILTSAVNLGSEEVVFRRRSNRLVTIGNREKKEGGDSIYDVEKKRV